MTQKMNYGINYAHYVKQWYVCCGYNERYSYEYELQLKKKKLLVYHSFFLMDIDIEGLYFKFNFYSINILCQVGKNIFF